MRFPSIGPAWWLLILGLLWAAYAHAVPLTPAQLATLKTDIHASNDLAIPLATGDYNAIAAAYNVTATPDFWVWRTDLRKYDIYSLPSPTGSNWDWAVYKAMTVPEQGTWLEMFANGVTNYALANIRAGVGALFTGAPPAVAQHAHVDAHGRRLVRRGERLYTTGTGSTAAPGLMEWEGMLTADDVANALALP